MDYQLSEAFSFSLRYRLSIERSESRWNCIASLSLFSSLSFSLSPLYSLSLSLYDVTYPRESIMDDWLLTVLLSSGADGSAAGAVRASAGGAGRPGAGSHGPGPHAQHVRHGPAGRPRPTARLPGKTHSFFTSLQLSSLFFSLLSLLTHQHNVFLHSLPLLSVHWGCINLSLSAVRAAAGRHAGASSPLGWSPAAAGPWPWRPSGNPRSLSLSSLLIRISFINFLLFR